MRTTAALLLAVLAVAGCKSREEALQAAEDRARFELDKKARAAAGIGAALSDSGKQAAEALSKGIGEVAKGAAAGFDTSLTAVDVRVARGVADLGVRVERSGRGEAKGRDASTTVSVYVVYDRPADARVVLRAMDRAGKEVGRVEQTLRGKGGSAAYTDFAFDGRAPLMLVDHYELGRVQ